MNKNIHPLTVLSKKEIDNLSNEALCDRMANVLYNILCESYTDRRAIDDFPRQDIQIFFNTKKIQSLSQKNQRTSLRKCFEYLVQHEYLSRVGGWLNHAVYETNYHENHSWLSPRIQSINCAINHIKIVGSGIAFDRMMDLLHIIETGEPLSSKKSKFKPFRKWLLNSQNKFVFFAPNLPRIHKFRSRLRTAEEHEWSSQPDKLLMLQPPTYDECNDPSKLTNILISMWNPFLDLLNEQIPNTTAGSGFEWLKAIQDNDLETIQNELNRLSAEIQ